MFKTGNNSYFSVDDAKSFLEVEGQHYEKTLDQAVTFETVIFPRDEIVEAMYNFYDKDGKYLVSWAYGRFTNVFNFCMDTK